MSTTLDDELVQDYADTTDAEESLANIVKKSDSLKHTKGGNSTTATKTLNTISGIVSDMSTLTGTLEELAERSASRVQYAATQESLKKTQLCTLRIKKISLKLKRKSLEMQKDMYADFSRFCENDATKATATAIIAGLQVVATVVSALLTVIQAIINAIPPMMLVSGKAMTFFLTPKSIKCTEMKPMNPGQDICNKLSPAIEEQIAVASNAVNKANNAKKIATIAAAAASGKQLIMNGGIDEMVEAADLQSTTAAKLYKVVEAMIVAFISPEALPKYEKLSITNPSYLAWLVPSFEPAMNKSFGLPM